MLRVAPHRAAKGRVLPLCMGSSQSPCHAPLSTQVCLMPCLEHGRCHFSLESAKRGHGCLQDSMERLSRQGSAHGTPAKGQRAGSQPAQHPLSSHAETAQAAWQLHSMTCAAPNAARPASAPASEAASPSGQCTPMRQASLQDQCALAPITSTHPAEGGACAVQQSPGAADGRCARCCQLEAELEELQSQVTDVIF